jgi:hypothetical protein
MLQRRPAERPSRVLQPLSQGHEASAAEHDMAVLPAGKGQTEVIKPVIERHAGDADAEIAHRGEIGQPPPTGRLLLPEDDIPIAAVERPPAPDAPF